MANVALEFGTLFRCIAVFKGKSASQRYFHFVRATVFMRGGIAITLILKYADFILTEWLQIYHMLFVVLGMVYYNRKLMNTAKEAAASAVTKSVSFASHRQRI